MIFRLFGILSLLFFAVSANLFSQDFDMEVRVVTLATLKADPAVFKDMERNIRDFMTKTSWSGLTYQPHERIKASLQLTISEELSETTFRGELIINSNRPVYNSSYQTPILTYVDKNLTFSYNLNQPIQRSDNSFYDNLSSTLTFYAYLILGLDADSFSPFGGDKYYNLMREVYNALPQSIQSSDPGWSNVGSPTNNKYWIIENLNNARIRPFRQAFYEYHRLALDKMYEDAERHRAVMMASLSTMDESAQNYPNAILLQLFAEAKRQEIVEIFKAGDRGQKLRVRNIMSKMDPAQKSVYEALN